MPENRSVRLFVRSTGEAAGDPTPAVILRAVHGPKDLPDRARSLWATGRSHIEQILRELKLPQDDTAKKTTRGFAGQSRQASSTCSTSTRPPGCRCTPIASNRY